ncbi:MAG: MFS transporter [Rhodothermia bacterium]|nr:MAG: MFS transporter [Rhodothermia bacterium]
MASSNEAGYLELIKRNTSFRRLWIGNVISLFGDWFNTIALYSLILHLTGSEFALGAVFITKMLPWALVAPFAGLLVDRFDRRKLMIWTDVLRAVIVLGLLLVDEASEIYLVYVITSLQVVIGSVFHPAQSASIPNITSGRELVTANTIMAATWSLLLTLGAALGGFATEYLGIKAVFLVDSASYLLSAFFIYRAVIPQDTEKRKGPVVLSAVLRDVFDGWAHVRNNPRIGRIALSKATWAIAGGGLVYMLALLGEEVAPGREAAAIGLLFAARGLGTGIGPVISRSVFKNRAHWPVVLGGCIVLTGIGYAVVGLVGWTYLVALPIIVAHSAGGVNWVLSSVMLQERTEDRFRGRVFSTEWLVIMSVDTLSILTASLVLEGSILILRQVILIFAVVQVLSGLLWLFSVVPLERRDEIARESEP